LWKEEQKNLYDTIKSLYDSGLGYQKISKVLNENGIKTTKGHLWRNYHVSSVLKRYEQKMKREKIKNLETEIEFGNMKLLWLKE